MRKRITREQYHKAGNEDNNNTVLNKELLDKLAEDIQAITGVLEKSTVILKNRSIPISNLQALKYVEFKNQARRAYQAFVKLLLKADNKLAQQYSNTKTEYYNTILEYEKAVDDMLPFVKFRSTCIQADALLKVYIGSAGRQAIRRVMSFLRRPRHSLYGMGAAGGGGLAYGRYRQKKQHAPTVNQMTDYESGVKPHALNRHNRSFE